MTVTPEILSDGSAVVESTGDENKQLRVRGVLIGEGDISTGMSGKPTRWTAEVLQEANDKDLFSGKPITIAPSFDPDQHVGISKSPNGLQIDEGVSFDDKVGEIEETFYEDGEGLFIEGFLSDAYSEELVDRGLAQISPVVLRGLEEVDASDTDYDELYEATTIQSVRDVALVADGGMPSNYIEALSVEALSARFDKRGDDDQDGQSTSDSASKETMTEDDNLTDEEREMLRKAGRFDNPTIVEGSEAEALSQANELLTEAKDTDDPKVVDASEWEALNNHIETIDKELGNNLQETRGLKEATVEAMSFQAKVSEFQDEEGHISLEALSQTPETGGNPDEDEEFSLEALSSEQVEKVESLAARAQTFDTIDPGHAEALRNDAAETAGVEDFDELAEVLE